MTLSEKRRHFSGMFFALGMWARTHGYDVAVDTTRRSLEEQKRLVAIGASATLKSRHVDGLAGDLVLYKGPAYLTAWTHYIPLGDYWKSLDPNNVWGGDWTTGKVRRDAGHFEYAG